MQSNNKQTSFKKIDDLIKTKKKSEQQIIYIMAFAVIIFLAYQFLYPITTLSRENSFQKMSSMKNEVNSKKIYLASNSNAKLLSLKKDVANKVMEYENNLYKISYVDNTLSELSYLLFNDENWARFVDNISHLAKTYGLEIKEITNHFYKPTYKKVSQVVTIEVKTKSSYKSMMKFLNKIEESKLVVDVSDLNISKPGSKLSSYFKISVWGMKY